MIPWRYRPGTGFVLLVVTTLSSVGFLAWGARTPPLDTVWVALLALETGGEVLPSSRTQLRKALQRHPELVDNVLDGEKYGALGTEVDGLVKGPLAIAVRRAADPPIVLNVLLARSAPGRVRVRARVNGVVRERLAGPDEPFVWRLPDDGQFPQMVEIEIERPESDAPSSQPGRAGTSVRWSALVQLTEEAP